MIPFDEFRAEEAQKIRFLLCDIDDTITEKGKLPAASYDALWRIHDAGIHVIPVTGRPAGWCDMIVREWPVRAVVGENGAFVYYFEDGHLQTWTHPSTVPNPRERLAVVRDAVLREIPGCRIAKDQFSRIYDLAVDFREDPPYLSFEDADRIKAVCERFGCVAKVSSIHVNAWFGDYSKVETAERFLRERLELRDLDEAIFFGDSPNDEPMFRRFPISCGVANIRDFEASVAYLPAYVTQERSAVGFAQACTRILHLRGIAEC